MKSNRQYKDSARFVSISILGIIILMIIMVLFSGCTGTYYITDTKYERTPIIYYNNQIYSGWSNGYYYYYGMPHYYPWNYYYNTCPPSHYGVTTHIVITRPVNKPTHKPNRPTYKPNRPIKNNTIIKVKPNRTNNNVIVKPNRNKNRSNNKRKPN